MATINWVVDNINDIATRISGSQWAKHVLPGFQQLQQEAGEKVASHLNANVRINGVVYGALDVGSLMGGTLSKIRGEDTTQLSGRIADRIKREATDTDADNIIDTLFNEYQEDYKKVFANSDDIDQSIQNAKDTLKGVFKSHLSGPAASPDANAKVILTPKEAYDSRTPLQKGQALAGVYFNPSNKDAQFARITAAAGVYMGAATAGRVMNGGTLTQDSYGRKDLVGIPFI